MTIEKIQLTSAEISQLWAGYMNDSFNICMMNYFLNNIDDMEIKPILEHSLALSEAHLDELTAIFQKDSHPVPVGFRLGDDVDIHAPRLFSDTYYLNFIFQYAILGLSANSLGLGLSVREDVTNYFTETVTETIKLHTMSKNLLLSKGLYIRSPFIPVPSHVDFIKEKSFLKGFLGDVRPLAVLEITNLYANIQRNSLGLGTMMAYSQVAQNPKVKQYMVRGRDIANKHILQFSEKMKDDYLPVPMTWDTNITKSTTYTFSDKLMMFQTTSLIALSIAFYGASMSTSPRRDLGVMYGGLVAEIGTFASDGAKLMIDHGWLEQPPLASDRDKLAGN